MPERKAYSYAVVRVVPRVEVEEFLNVGVIVFAAELRFLAAHVAMNAARLRALWPEVELEAIERHLGIIPLICAGEEAAGPISRLTPKERFYWLTAPRSTVVQTSAVRTGITENAERVLEELMREYVR